MADLATAPAPPALDLDVRRLRVLRAVGAHGSFAAAADALGYTPSAVSQQVAALEREAGVQLVLRGPRGTQLTEAGAVLDRHAALVLGQLAAARAALDDLAGLRAGTVRLAAFGSAWVALVPAALVAFGAAHPAVEVRLAEQDPAAAAAALRDGTCDLAVVFEPGGAGDLVGLRRELLCHDPLRVVLPAGHPLAAAPAVDLADLAEEPWVVPTEHCGALVRGACTAAGFTPRVAFETGDYGAIQGFVGAGTGVALVPALAQAGAGRVVHRPLAGPPVTRTLALLRRESGTPAAADALARHLRDAAARLLATAG